VLDERQEKGEGGGGEAGGFAEICDAARLAVLESSARWAEGVIMGSPFKVSMMGSSTPYRRCGEVSGRWFTSRKEVQNVWSDPCVSSISLCIVYSNSLDTKRSERWIFRGDGWWSRGLDIASITHFITKTALMGFEAYLLYDLSLTVSAA